MSSKTCNKCGREKPLEAFPRCCTSEDGRHWWCKTCQRVAMVQHRQTERYRKTIAAYLDRPEVRERKKQIDRQRAESRKPSQRAYRQTPRARILHCRRQARVRLRKTTDPQRQKEIEKLIEMYEAELVRMEKRTQLQERFK